MAKTQYYTATSIDGFIADQHNSLDWLFEVGGEDGGGGNAGFGEFFAQVGAFAMGATTYEWVLDHEKLLEQPENWTNEYHDVPAWIFTHRDLPRIPGANLTFVQGDVRPMVRHESIITALLGALTGMAAGLGLAAIVTSVFADAGLFDELILGVAPVTLGSGAPLLPRRLTASRLTLTDMTRNGQFAHLTYTVGPAGT